MPEIWVGDDGVFREKDINDLLIPCQRGKFLFCIWLIQLWATEHDQLLWRFQHCKFSGILRIMVSLKSGCGFCDDAYK